MTIRRHGITVGIERLETRLLVSFKACGTLTHQDYQTITPIIESALAEVKHPQIRGFFDASELEGWEMRAAWDDLKLGLKHGHSFEKMAILGHQQWLEWASKVGKWFIAGEVRVFKDEQAALAWLED
ncbi:STAS/SEC14 domain-containing protein [Agarivorans sp. Toyoura001]|uniref:STAS/SEC14 domain-containing protein n=1 Tax=unclassified Agarivorans TaxID=2636026 RepID=UPI0010E12BF0|nr:STAS/SEC14 domain-containing protein [Agarivorans sp. Toyoura001]GDY25530.1 STAS/SEC14 domain-containing protein [Agarivorans sp. Toyoura001]